MGRQKLLEAIDGRPMIAHAVAAAASWPTVVVASAAVAAALPGGVRVVPNHEPERGMTYSLKLADATIARDEAIAVVLGDVPDLDAATLARVLSAYDDGVDVVAGRAAGRVGHPVVFGPAARAKIAALPDGDALRALRDDPALRRRFVDLDDPRVFDDVDTEAELAARRAR